MANMISIIEERKDEIIGHITSNELKIATKRTLDFAKDFSDRKRVNEVILHQHSYNEIHEEIRKFGKTLEDSKALKKLIEKLLDLLDVIVDEFEEKQTKEKNIEDNTRQTIEEAKKAFLLKRINKKNIVFKCQGVTKKYKNKSIGFEFLPIDLELKIGEITAIVGENGSGKTTLLNMIAGELLPTSGEIEYPAFSDDLNDYYRIKQQISYIKQELPKWSGLLVDNLHFSASIKGITGQQNIDEVEFIIYRLGLEKYRDEKWKVLSGGYKMRFTLAKSLVWNPKLLILDEPLANLDIKKQQEFLEDLRDLKSSEKNPMAVILTSQHLYEVEGIADNIIFLSNGEALYNGTLKEFGEDRTENSFEIRCDLSKQKLFDRFDNINSIDISGRDYIVNTPLDVNKERFLNLLLKQNINIDYFRDISCSTRKLFKDER